MNSRYVTTAADAATGGTPNAVRPALSEVGRLVCNSDRARAILSWESSIPLEVGLEQTNGNYRLVVALFNMPSEDYKRFLGFLRKHNCHLPFQQFRTVSGRSQGGSRPVAVAG